MVKQCSVCGAPVGDNAEILTIAGFGTARRLCPSCASLIDEALSSNEYGRIASATEELAERLAARDCEDGATLSEMADIFETAKSRAEKISRGEEPDEPENAEEDCDPQVPEELLESEEDRLLDEKEAEEAKKSDRLFAYFGGGFLAAAIIYVLLDFVFNLF